MAHGRFEPRCDLAAGLTHVNVGGSASLRQGEDVERVPTLRLVNLRGDLSGEAPERARERGRDGDELPAFGLVGDGISVRRGTEAGLPKDIPCPDVERPVVAVRIASEDEAAGRRERRRQEGGPLLSAPQLLHRPDVVGGQLPHLPVRAGHLAQLVPARRAATTVNEIHLAASQVHAGLMERDHERADTRVIRRRLPVVSAKQTGAGGHAITHAGVSDILPVRDASGGPVD